MHDVGDFMNVIEGNIASPAGFRASGIHAGLKKSRKDMALIVSECPAVSAAAFTTNRVKAAPVLYDMKILEKGCARAVVVNSGNANACTGEQGYRDCEETASYAASALGIASDEVFVSSTGVIGQMLDMTKIKKGIDSLVSALGKDGEAAAEAILTTDTVKKEVCVSVNLDGKEVRIAGMAKGSGMIHPNMATMLCFITSDAAISHDVLQDLLGTTVEDTFNMISVDGDTSTNDTVIVLANGMAGNRMIEKGSDSYIAFSKAFDYVLRELAKKIVKDGEGADRFIEMKVEGASGQDDARALARSVVSSSLVKAAFFGSDANWGRILCAMGYSGAAFSFEKVDLFYSSAAGSIQVLKSGSPIAFDEDEAKKILLEKEICVRAVLHDGSACATAWGCDLTYDYVRINGDYRS